MLGHKNSQSTDRNSQHRPQSPTEWDVKPVSTEEGGDQLIIENWQFHRFDAIHQKAIYRRPKSLSVL